MSSIIRWNPMREMMNLRREMDRIFERTVSPEQYEWPETATWGLALDVAENEDSFMVKASVPGIKPDDLDITISENVLTIKGTYEADESVNEEKYHIRERRYGSFGRSLRLPVPVNADAVTADYEDGVLTLTVPKSEAVKPRRIAINAHTNGHS